MAKIDAMKRARKIASRTQCTLTSACGHCEKYFVCMNSAVDCPVSELYKKLTETIIAINIELNEDKKEKANGNARSNETNGTMEKI